MTAKEKVDDIEADVSNNEKVIAQTSPGLIREGTTTDSDNEPDDNNDEGLSKAKNPETGTVLAYDKQPW